MYILYIKLGWLERIKKSSPFFLLCGHVDAAVPPWVGYSEEETIQQQILALSAVSRWAPAHAHIITNIRLIKNNTVQFWIQEAKRATLRQDSDPNFLTSWDMCHCTVVSVHQGWNSGWWGTWSLLLMDPKTSLFKYFELLQSSETGDSFRKILNE